MMPGKAKSNETGQSLLEFALMLPVMILLMVGVADIGRAIFYSVTAANAATAGVEYGSQDTLHAQGQAGSTMKQAAVDDGNGFVKLADTTSAHGCRCDDGTGLSCTNPIPLADCTTIVCGGQPVIECVQVTTHETFSPLFQWPGLPTSYTANGNAVMRVRPGTP